MKDRESRELVKLLEKRLGIPCQYLNAKELKEYLEPEFECKICGEKVRPFTEIKHLEEKHGIVFKKMSDLVRHYKRV